MEGIGMSGKMSKEIMKSHMIKKPIKIVLIKTVDGENSSCILAWYIEAWKNWSSFERHHFQFQFYGWWCCTFSSLCCWHSQGSFSEVHSPYVGPSVNLFSNRIGSHSFHPIFPIFGLNVHNNITQKVLQVVFLFFASKFLMHLWLQK